MAIIKRRKNAVTGTITGITLQVLNILVPFIVRFLIIQNIGIEYSGLHNLFISIFQIFGIFELGIGSVFLYSMFKPIVENDTNKICGLMKLYRFYYRIVGIATLVVGLITMPLITFLISGDIPSDVNLYFLYFLSLASLSLSYFLFSYKTSVLFAHQRNDVSNIISIILNIIVYIIQIVCLIYVKNFYLYFSITLVTPLIANCATGLTTHLMYPTYMARGSLEISDKNEIKIKIGNMFVTKLDSTFSGSIFNILISSFLGLTILGKFNNYYIILTSILLAIIIIFSSTQAGVGNKLIRDSKESNIKVFYRLTFLLFFLISICAPCFLNLYQPFIKIWLGEEYLLDNTIMILIVVNFILEAMPILCYNYKDAAGIWKEDKYRIITGLILKIICGITFTYFYGLYGMLITQIVLNSLIYVPRIFFNIKKYVLQFDTKSYLFRILSYCAVIITSCLVSYFICNSITLSGISEIVVKLVISILISSFIFIIVFCRSAEFKSAIRLFKKYIFKKKNRQ